MTKPRMWGITCSFAFLEILPDEPWFRSLIALKPLSTLLKNTCVIVFTPSEKKKLPLPTSQYHRDHQNRRHEEICTLAKSLPSLEWTDHSRPSFPLQGRHYFTLTKGYWEDVAKEHAIRFCILGYLCIADYVVSHPACCLSANVHTDSFGRNKYRVYKRYKS
jgi:hypothetical protein